MRQPLGKLTAREFLERYWQKRPLLVRGAFNNFSCPVDKKTLLSLALSPTVESRLVQERSRPAFRVEHGPFGRRRFARLPKSHWTLLVQDVDKHLPRVASLLEPFTFLPHWRVDDIMISYAAQQGSVGPHYDNYDVFLLQGAGQRRWQIGKKPKTPKLRANTELRVLENFSAEQELIVGPGDLLYLPPHIAHHGIADTESITLSIGFRAPSQRELAFAFVEELLQDAKDDVRYADPDLRTPKHTGAIDHKTLSRVKRLLRPVLEPKPGQLDHWFGRFVTEPKPGLVRQRPGITVTATQLRQMTRPGVAVQRALGSRWAFHADPKLMLFVDGEAWGLPKRLFPLVAALCDGPTVELLRFSRLLHDPAAGSLLKDLFQRGLLASPKSLRFYKP